MTDTKRESMEAKARIAEIDSSYPQERHADMLMAVYREGMEEAAKVQITHAFCDGCGEIVPVYPVVMVKDDLNEHPWSDIVCTHCHGIIATITSVHSTDRGEPPMTDTAKSDYTMSKSAETLDLIYDAMKRNQSKARKILAGNLNRVIAESFDAALRIAIGECQKVLDSPVECIDPTEAEVIKQRLEGMADGR
jgi:hypothetical protein